MDKNLNSFKVKKNLDYFFYSCLVLRFPFNHNHDFCSELKTQTTYQINGKNTVSTVIFSSTSIKSFESHYIRS